MGTVIADGETALYDAVAAPFVWGMSHCDQREFLHSYSLHSLVNRNKFLRSDLVGPE